MPNLFSQSLQEIFLAKKRLQAPFKKKSVQKIFFIEGSRDFSKRYEISYSSEKFLESNSQNIIWIKPIFIAFLQKFIFGGFASSIRSFSPFYFSYFSKKRQFIEWNRLNGLDGYLSVQICFNPFNPVPIMLFRSLRVSVSPSHNHLLSSRKSRRLSIPPTTAWCA